MNKIITILTIIFLPVCITAQTVDIAEPMIKSPVHLKMGMGLSSVMSGEFQHPRPYFGFNVGAQTMLELNKKISFFTELNLHFKGSNFNTESDTSYSKLRLLSLELPIGIAYYLTKKEEVHQFVFLAVQPAWHLDKAIYFNGENVKKPIPYGLHDYDIQAVIGHQYQILNVGVQTSFKLGLMDLNNNFFIANAYPAFGTGKPIKTWSFEVALIF